MSKEIRENNLPVRATNDGFSEDDDTSDRVIQGSLLKCVDGHWHDRDGLPVPLDTQRLVLATATIVQLWRDQLPVETIVKQTGKPLPNVEELNAAIPEGDWEEGLDGKPRPPWQKQEVVYLLDAATAEKYTFASGTIGARIAVMDLRDRVKWMRALRGEDVIPVVELASRPMKTRFGGKLRPEFRIVGWREFGVGLASERVPQVQQQAKPAKPLEQATPSKPTSAPKKTKRGGLKQVSLPLRQI